MMLKLPSRFVPAAFVLASVAAQAPDRAGEIGQRPEIVMQSLQSLTTETVFLRQPLGAVSDQETNGGGSAAYRPFARIRDARFQRDGRLVELLVEAPEAATDQPPGHRVLPAKAVRWDDTTKRWLTVEATLAFVELAEVSKLAAGTEPVVRKENQPLLASQLMLATAGGCVSAPAKDAAVETSATKTPKSTAMLWFVPGEQVLSFAVVPHGTKQVPVPWSKLQIEDHGGSLQLLIEAEPARLEDSPTCKDAVQQPSAELRQLSYQHYGVPSPKWELQPSAKKDRKELPEKSGGKRNDR
jgi:hypothetical protein